ncbi:MAG: hypothetical protein JWO94_3880, partial [Verrucomicrobiaceae bacterium]|nr:hypothetical protein [Verrucomicrobiaceae bacterium]
DPEIDALSDVFLYNIDQLSEIAEEGRMERQKQAAICEKIIEEQLEKFSRSSPPPHTGEAPSFSIP